MSSSAGGDPHLKTILPAAIKETLMLKFNFPIVATTNTSALVGRGIQVEYPEKIIGSFLVSLNDIKKIEFIPTLGSLFKAQR